MNNLDLLRLSWVLAFLNYLSLSYGLALLWRFVWAGSTETRRRMGSIGLSVFTVFAMFFVFELIFAFAIIESDGFGHTLASRLWFDRYWKPINSRGYRDYESKQFAGHSVVFIVGDSFVAGHGTKQIEDRFANRAAAMLGGHWEHVVIAHNGWDTGAELKAVKDYPYPPDVIVLSYYINDIEGAAEAQGFRLAQLFRRPGPLTNWVVNKSFFLNWLYWRIYRRSVGDEYWNYLRASYSNPDVWNAHALELQGFVEHAQSRNIGLCVVVWPSLSRMSESWEFTSKVVGFFRSRGVCVIDLAEVFRGRRSSDLVVNGVDAHPNAATHHEVGALLYHKLSTIRVQKKAPSGNGASATR
jgi:hypothetical protein